jgi:protein-tyrosine kinase
MSRIYEALKKIERDRVAALASELGVSLPVDAVPAPEGEVESVAGTETKVLTQTVAESPKIYSSLDDLSKHCVHHRWHSHPKSTVFFDATSTALGAEQFRTLRSRLYQLRGNHQLQTLLITSAVPGEGKTFVTSNLAQAIVCQPNRSALIIDADLRRPYLHIPLGAPAAPGLTDYLQGNADEASVIQHGQIGNLYFIPAGKEVANPSELLMNGRLKTLLDRVGPLFDWVILDSPPCLLVADARVIADLCDGILLVVRAASTEAGAAQRACQELQGRRVLGAVLNGVEGGSYYSGTYYAYADKDRSMKSKAQ